MSAVKPEYDTIGSVGLQELYQKYTVSTFEEFREYCFNILRKSRSPDEKKASIERSWHEVRTKDRLLQKVNNFALAGEGLKVI